MRVDPWVEVRSVRALGESALVEVNVTAPGTLLCAYHAASIRPAFVDRPVRHAGAARVLLGGLQPATRYTVECSLNAGNRTVQSAGKSFESGEAAARLTITDVEPFATFARIRGRGAVRDVRADPSEERHAGRRAVSAAANAVWAAVAGGVRAAGEAVSRAGREEA